ncbi:MAG: Rossmann-like and DUF2520 domain-containing protein [Bacteroidales bacterium]
MVILGAGNVATHYSRHFNSLGYTISTIYSRTLAHARTLAEEVMATGTDRIEEIPEASDFYLVCLPDREVARMGNMLKDRQGIWIHTAGAVPLEELRESHPECGVLYPLQTLSRQRPVSLKKVPLLIEGSSAQVTARIRMLADGMSDEVHEMNSGQRLILHLAAVFANNFTNHMIRIAGEILTDAGVEPQLLIPLLEETIKKAGEMGAASAQTGPAIRGDIGTQQKHLEILEHYPEWKKLYTFISRDIGRSGNK